jgi:hypothetical protein
MQSKQDKYREKTEEFSLREKTSVQEGLVTDRKCTDVFFLIVFVAFIAAMGAIVVYSLTHGQIEKVLAPYDKFKHFCGHDGYEDYPYMYLTDVDVTSASTTFGSGICVKECPKDGDSITYMN